MLISHTTNSSDNRSKRDFMTFLGSLLYPGGWIVPTSSPSLLCVIMLFPLWKYPYSMTLQILHMLWYHSNHCQLSPLQSWKAIWVWFRASVWLISKYHKSCRRWRMGFFSICVILAWHLHLHGTDRAKIVKHIRAMTRLHSRWRKHQRLFEMVLWVNHLECTKLRVYCLNIIICKHAFWQCMALQKQENILNSWREVITISRSYKSNNDMEPFIIFLCHTGNFEDCKGNDILVIM